MGVRVGRAWLLFTCMKFVLLGIKLGVGKVECEVCRVKLKEVCRLWRRCTRRAWCTRCARADVGKIEGSWCGKHV